MESDSGIHSFIINNQNGRKADVSIDGKKLGRNNVLIRDKYYQYESITVRVKETRLVLSNNYNTDLTTGRSEYIDVLSRYKGISSLTPSNDSIRAELVRDLNGNEQIKIIPLKAGSAYLRVQDQKGSVQYLSFRVNGKDVEEEEKNTNESSGKANFKEIHYSKKSNDEGIDTLGFKLEGEFDEVGIFYLENGEVYKQVLEKDNSGLYILSCTVTCPEKSLPYIISNNTYKKASVDYISFGEESYGIANTEESGVEINSIAKEGNTYYQSGTPYFSKDDNIKLQYLNGIEIAIIDFLNEDTKNHIWNSNTATKIVNLASGKRTLQSSIDAIPDIKVIWDQIERDIRNGTYSYDDESKRFLKGYLGVSAVIEEDDWRTFNQGRVKEYVESFHEKRKLIKKGLFSGIYDSKINYFIGEVEMIATRIVGRFKKDPSLARAYSSQDTYIVVYTKDNVNKLRSIGAITQAEYNVLIKYEDQLIYLYSEAIKELTFIEKKQGSTEGSDQALEDYIVSSLSLFNPTEFLEVLYALKDVDLESLTEDFEELAAIYKNREEIFAGLSEYDKAYYTGYIETTLAMAVIPVKLNKANRLKKEQTETEEEISELKKKQDAKDLTNLSQQMTDPSKITRDNVSRLLELSESGVGHTIQKHVGKSDNDLKERVQNNINQGQSGKTATTFTDLATVEKTIRDVLKTSEGQDLIKKTINRSRQKKIEAYDAITIDTKTKIGHGYTDVNGIPTKIEGLTKVSIIILPDGKGGFILNTVFPVK